MPSNYLFYYFIPPSYIYLYNNVRDFDPFHFFSLNKNELFFCLLPDILSVPLFFYILAYEY